jgi:hypothetical protein
MNPPATPSYTSRLLVALAGAATSAACTSTPTPTSDFEGTWKCSINEIDLAEGGAQLATGTFAFTAGSGGTLTSTETDDAGVLQCTIQYIEDGGTATVSSGQSCSLGGVRYAISGSASVMSSSLDFNVTYMTGSGAVTDGIIEGMCSR